MKKFNIAVVSDYFYPSIGGTQVLAKGIADYFYKNGHNIQIITSPDPNRTKIEYPVLEVKDYNTVFQNNKYDVVIVLADLFSLSAHSLPQKLIKKSVLILNLDENVFKWVMEGKIGQIPQRVAKLHEFDQIVSFCKGAPVNKFLELAKLNYVHIPNFSFDTMEYNKQFTKQELGLNPNKKVLFNHGLIETRKNQLKLAQAFLQSDLNKEYQLVFLGGPRGESDLPYYNECLKMTQHPDIHILKGTSDKNIISACLKMADVYVLPSTAEGLPLVTLEGMSAGLPWVSTPVGGVPGVMYSLKSGKILSSLEINPLELAMLVRQVDGKGAIARKEWEENFTAEKIGKQYENLVKQLNPTKEDKIKYLKTKKISFGNQVYNEPIGIKNYLASCLQFAGIVDEVYIVNHRSNDNTLQVIESFADKYKEAGIALRWETEVRDLSDTFTIADVFGKAVSGCENELVFRHDADFVFGDGYIDTMYDALKVLENDTYYAVGYEIPCVSNHLQMEDSIVKDYGICNLHVSVPRVFKKSKTICLQKHVNGKYEWFYPTDKNCPMWKTICYYESSLLSINIKSEERMELRKTMNTFMEDIASGKAKGDWLQQQALRKEEEDWTKEDENLTKCNIKDHIYIY